MDTDPTVTVDEGVSPLPVTKPCSTATHRPSDPRILNRWLCGPVGLENQGRCWLCGYQLAWWRKIPDLGHGSDYNQT